MDKNYRAGRPESKAYEKSATALRRRNPLP
jgi:hypothetical protein